MPHRRLIHTSQSLQLPTSLILKMGNAGSGKSSNFPKVTSGACLSNFMPLALHRITPGTWHRRNPGRVCRAGGQTDGNRMTRLSPPGARGSLSRLLAQLLSSSLTETEHNQGARPSAGRGPGQVCSDEKPLSRPTSLAPCPCSRSSLGLGGGGLFPICDHACS